MNTFLFLMILISTIICMVGIIVCSYYYTTQKFDRKLTKYLISVGYKIVDIKKTSNRFTVIPVKSIPKVSLGGPLFGYSGSGSGLHYREVKVLNIDNDQKTIYIAVEIYHFRHIHYHIS